MSDSSQYIFNYEPVVGPLEKLDVNKIIESAGEQWFNQTLTQVDEVVVRIGVFTGGEFPWHKHDNEDEFFLVLDGRVRIDVEGLASADLGPRECFTVPKGRMHRPVVSERSTVLMIERAGVVATGDA
ncbi:MAG TPA: cupin domain-containing protein [Stackebrandtia sp.]|uniref:cupin domain-containing protein n=1 Tax=Stackebrandtia sp. TaxID=2023065 RepID=UPI002D7319D0|nr:cupin domain-containing protein [Stackebrandtia sp.]HZE37205.1 cupin domain-containing protein [Stackebrandtia sp.]